jgi:hypothetical protein
MKKVLLTISILVFFATVSNAQFITKKKTVTSTTGASHSIAPNTNDSTSPFQIGSGPSFLLGGGGNEAIVTAEMISGSIGKNGKLAFGGSVAKSSTNTNTDLKTVLQGGGNFFLSYTKPLSGLCFDANGSTLITTFRNKLGFVLPALGSTTNVIQAHWDPGFELNYSAYTTKKELGLLVSVRGAFIWSTKDFADNVGLTKNFFPYLYISGGLDLSEKFQIVYSQQFFARDILNNPLPAASLGVSVVMQ